MQLGHQSSASTVFTVSFILWTLHYWCRLRLLCPLVRLSPCPHIITLATVAVEPGELQWFDPTWSIFYCLVFNIFLKSRPISFMKKIHHLVPCLFRVFVWERWLGWGGEVGCTLLWETLVSLGGDIEKRVWLCLFVCMCLSLVIKWWLVHGAGRHPGPLWPWIE